MFYSANMKSFISALTALLLLQINSSLSLPSHASSDNQIGARITDGENAYPGQFPYQVSLQWGLPPFTDYKHTCGASIINEYWILTAGHCVTHSITSIFGKIIVKVGKHHLLTDDKYVQVREIEKKIAHENFPGKVAPYDIALIKVKVPFSFNERVQPVELPNHIISGNYATLSGWGSTSRTSAPRLPLVLQTVSVPILKNEDCLKTMRAMGSKAEIFDSMLCTGPLNGTISACVGDSGGPLVQYENERAFIVGIVSWGMYPCGTGAPSVYTRVSSYVEWINTQINKN